MLVDALSDLFDRIESNWARALPHSLQRGCCWSDYADTLTKRGYLPDTRIGLGVISSCRDDLPSIESLPAFMERTVRHFGYRGGALSLYDFRDERSGRATLLFFDRTRFREPADAVSAYLKDTTILPWPQSTAA